MRHIIEFYLFAYLSRAVVLAVVTTSEPKKSTAATVGKKRDVQTTIPSSSSSSERQSEVRNSHAGSTPRRTETDQNVEDRQTSSTKKDVVASHAAKRKKLARNEKLIGNDGFDIIDQKQIPETDTAVTDLKSVSASEVAAATRSGTDLKSDFERVRSPTAAEKTRDVVDTVVDANKTGHVSSETQDRHVVAVDAPSSSAAAGNSSAVEKTKDKDRADLLDDVDDDVAVSFAMFVPVKSTSGAGNATAAAAAAAEEFPAVSQSQRTDSYDRLSTGGAAIAMADSGYQTYDHDLSALDDRQPRPVSAKPEVPSELEVQSSVCEPDGVDTAVRYSASSDSEISVELPSCASSSGADKPTSIDWQLPLDTVRDDDRQSGKVARRASEEDLDQIRSDMTLHLTAIKHDRQLRRPRGGHGDTSSHFLKFCIL